MSDIEQSIVSAQADHLPPLLKALIERTVVETLARAGVNGNPFINSKACAELVGISPEHLCAMRARGQGPPWSGEGKWIRYRRSDVVSWLSQLPTTPQPTASTATET